MKEIPLTQGKVALVDDADYERVSQFKWHARRSRNTFYASRNSKLGENGKRTTIRMHNFLLGGRADHIDGNGLDNRKTNTRLAADTQNKRAFQSKCVGCTSRYRGVCWHKHYKKWRAQIRLVSGKVKHLGFFEVEESAARAYDTAALARDIKFHHLNFPV